MESFELRLKIYEGQNIPISFFGNKVRYVSATIISQNGDSGEEFKTSSIVNKKRPIWNSTFNIKNVKKTDKLVLKLFNGNNSPLSKHVIEIGVLEVNETNEMFVTLNNINNNKNEGELHIILQLANPETPQFVNL